MLRCMPKCLVHASACVCYLWPSVIQTIVWAYTRPPSDFVAINCIIASILYVRQSLYYHVAVNHIIVKSDEVVCRLCSLPQRNEDVVYRTVHSRFCRAAFSHSVGRGIDMLCHEDKTTCSAQVQWALGGEQPPPRTIGPSLYRPCSSGTLQVFPSPAI